MGLSEGVEVRDEAGGMMGEQVRGLKNEWTKERSEWLRESRYERSRERRRKHERGNEMEGMEENLVYIVTWNVPRMTMREHNRRRLKMVCEKIQKEGREVLLLSGSGREWWRWRWESCTWWRLNSRYEEWIRRGRRGIEGIWRAKLR